MTYVPASFVDYLTVFRQQTGRHDFISAENGGYITSITNYEIFSLVIAAFGLMIGVITLLLKLFAILDSRYKRK